MEPRSVGVSHGWAWIAQGFALFRQSAATWFLVVVILFAATKILAIVPLVGALFALVFVLLMPVFLAGLMEGCREIERGGRLRLDHLTSGFKRNAAQLVTLGGVSLVGNLAVMMIVLALGGDALSALAKAVPEGAAPSADIQAAAGTLARALIVGTVVSVPLLMALWYSPLLVYFDDMGAISAMKSSLVGCWRNALPLLVYGAVIIAAMFVTMPIALALRHYDLAMWLLAPVVLPSIYASYRDVYRAATQRTIDQGID